MTTAGMPPSDRVAVVMLRGADGRVRARVHWPDRPVLDGAPPLLVLFDDASCDCDAAPRLAGLLHVVALSATPATLPSAITTLEWAADHAADLGADGHRLVLAGTGTGAGLAAAASLHARRTRWPAIAHQLLIAPACDREPERLLTLAVPTTVVTIGDDPRLPRWIRHSGTAVEVVHDATATAALDALARSVARALPAPVHAPPAELPRRV